MTFDSFESIDDIDNEFSDNEVLESGFKSDSDEALLILNMIRRVDRRLNKRKRSTATASKKRWIQRCGRCNAVGYSRKICIKKI